jgi:hypothetical protein
VRSGALPGYGWLTTGTPPSRVTTRPSPTSRRSVRFCLACPRWAIGAAWLVESMKVAKWVMSSASADRSGPNSAIQHPGPTPGTPLET